MRALMRCTKGAAAPVPACAGAPAPHMGVPWVAKEACRLLGDFSAWFDRARRLPAEAAALGCPEAAAALQVGLRV